MRYQSATYISGHDGALASAEVQRQLHNLKRTAETLRREVGDGEAVRLRIWVIEHELAEGSPRGNDRMM
jgi:hypothetical protein